MFKGLKIFLFSKHKFKTGGMISYICNRFTIETEAGKLLSLGLPWPLQFVPSQPGYIINSHFKNKNKRINKYISKILHIIKINRNGARVYLYGIYTKSGVQSLVLKKKTNQKACQKVKITQSKVREEILSSNRNRYRNTSDDTICP